MTNLSKAKATNVTEINSATGSNVYDEIARLNFTQELKISLFSYFTLNEKVKVNAESVLAICENDEDKFTYLNDILNSIKNSDLLEKSRSIENELVNGFNECTTSVMDVEPSPEVDLKKFAQKLNLEQLEPDDPLKNENIKKFYEFAGPDFDWPSTSSINERREIYNHITSPSPKFLEGQGRELAMNLLAYRRLIESGELDDSKGNYVQIEHGKLVCCGEKISVEKYNELFKKNPVMVYAPVKHDKVIIRVSLDTTEKEWQVHMRIRRKNSTDEIATMANFDKDFRLVIDTGSTITIIPYFVRERMKDSDRGWDKTLSTSAGYGGGVNIHQVMFPWEVSLGDGTNWTEWIETSELYCWQKKVPIGVDCGLVGFDVLNKTYQLKIPERPYIFVTERSVINQMQQIYNNA